MEAYPNKYKNEYVSAQFPRVLGCFIHWLLNLRTTPHHAFEFFSYFRALATCSSPISVLVYLTSSCTYLASSLLTFLTRSQHNDEILRFSAGLALYQRWHARKSPMFTWLDYRECFSWAFDWVQIKVAAVPNYSAGVWKSIALNLGYSAS